MNDPLITLLARERHIAAQGERIEGNFRDDANRRAEKYLDKALNLASIAPQELSHSPTKEALISILRKLIEQPGSVEALFIPNTDQVSKKWIEYFSNNWRPTGVNNRDGFIIPVSQKLIGILTPLITTLENIEKEILPTLSLDEPREMGFGFRIESGGIKIRNIDGEFTYVYYRHLDNSSPILMCHSINAKTSNDSGQRYHLCLIQPSRLDLLSFDGESSFGYAVQLPNNAVAIKPHGKDKLFSKLFTLAGQEVSIGDLCEFKYLVDLYRQGTFRFEPKDATQEDVLAKQGVVVGSSYGNTSSRFVEVNMHRQELIRYPDGFFDDTSLADVASGYVQKFDKNAISIEVDHTRGNNPIPLTPRRCVVDLSSGDLIPIGGEKFLKFIDEVQFDNERQYCIAQRKDDLLKRPFIRDSNGRWNECEYDGYLSIGDKLALRSIQGGRWRIYNSLFDTEPAIITDSAGNKYSEFEEILCTSLPTSSGNHHESFAAKVGDKVIVSLNQALIEHEGSALFDDFFVRSTGGYSNEDIYLKREDRWFKTHWYYTIDPLKECESPK